MLEKMSEVYEMYDMEILGTGRGRGAIILKTDKGIRQLMPLSGTDKRINEEKNFKDRLYDAGFIHIDRLIENTEGELVTWDRYGTPFVMREYFEGRECMSGNPEDLKQAAGNLAEFHIKAAEVQTDGRNIQDLSEGLFKKTREMKKIRTFISKRPDKNEFELTYIKAFDYFYRQAKECETMLINDTSGGPEHMGYCHGAYNYHSLLFCDGYIATMGFDRFHAGCQLMDLYQFIRKVMEKNNYNFEFVILILEEYNRVIPLCEKDYDFIYMMCSYPEKFWKIGNRYMNSKKSWISPVNMEKLLKVIADEQEKQKILSEFTHYYGVHKKDFR